MRALWTVEARDCCSDNEWMFLGAYPRLKDAKLQELNLRQNFSWRNTRVTKWVKA